MFESQLEDDLGINLHFYSQLNLPFSPLFEKLESGNNDDESCFHIQPEPSFKSKRYRDKLREEIRTLESLLPVDRSHLQRRLDCQTVFRIALGYLRTKAIFDDSLKYGQNLPDVTDVAQHLCSEEESVLRSIRENLDEYLDGFLMVVREKGTICYTSVNVKKLLGHNSADLINRNISRLLHPDDTAEFKRILECKANARITRKIKMKKLKDSTHDYMDVHLDGKMKHLATNQTEKGKQTSVLLAICRLVSGAKDGGTGKNSGEASFWSKHEMDMNIIEVEKSATDILGYDPEELQGVSFYSLIHPEDLACCKDAHTGFIETKGIQTVYYRLMSKSGQWSWLHTRGKVIYKASKKYSIILSNTLVREETSIQVQEESLKRHALGLSPMISKPQSLGQEVLRISNQNSSEVEQFGVQKHISSCVWTQQIRERDQNDRFAAQPAPNPYILEESGHLSGMFESSECRTLFSDSLGLDKQTDAENQARGECIGGFKKESRQFENAENSNEQHCVYQHDQGDSPVMPKIHKGKCTATGFPSCYALFNDGPRGLHHRIRGPQVLQTDSLILDQHYNRTPGYLLNQASAYSLLKNQCDPCFADYPLDMEISFRDVQTEYLLKDCQQTLFEADMKKSIDDREKRFDAIHDDFSGISSCSSSPLSNCLQQFSESGSTENLPSFASAFFDSC